FASAEALDDRLHLQELLLRVLLVLGSGDYALGARAQAREELAHVRVLSGLGEQADVAVRVVVDLLQRGVNRVDALSNLLPLAMQLRLEVRDLADRVLVQQVLEALLEAREVVGAELLEHRAIFVRGLYAHVHFAGLDRPVVLVAAHRIDDPLEQALELLGLRIDPGLQPIPHVALAVVARFDGKAMLAERVGAHRFELREEVRLRLLRRRVEQDPRIGELGLPGLALRDGLAALVARALELRAYLGEAFLERAELRLQRAEHVGRGLELVPLRGQSLDLDRQRPPVELAKVGEHHELAQCAAPLAEAALLLADLCDTRVPDLHPPREVRRLLRERRDLRLVAPAEHVARAVVERVPIVLLVAIALGFDLPGARYGFALAAILLEARAARGVEAARELALEPAVELGIGPDRDLAHERVRAELRQRAVAPVEHTVVDEPAAQMRAIDPRRDGGVVLVRHEQRQTEIVQQALDRAFPVALVVAHLEQLAGERQRVGGQPERLAEPLAKREHRGRNVRPPKAQRRELRLERFALLLQRAHRHLLLGEPVLDFRLPLLERFERALGFASVRGESGRIARLVHAELTCEPGVKLRAPVPLGLPLLELRDLGFQLLDAVAAVVADRAADGLALGGERALRVRMLVRT